MMMKKLLTGLATGLLSLMITGVASADNITNLALNGIASQSSTGSSGYAFFGNDGNTSGIYGYESGSVTHTSGFDKGWWQVDLGNSYDIDTITLWNRTDCCSDRLQNFNVSVLGANNSVVWSETYLPQFGTSLSFTLPDETIGQLVKVSLNDYNYLSLAEVQVFGDTSTNSVPEPTTMLLFGTGITGLVGSRFRRKKSR